MTKADLVEEVTQLGDLTRRDGEMIVDTIFDSVIHALRTGDKIEIRGFGSFRIRQRKPRTESPTSSPAKNCATWSTPRERRQDRTRPSRTPATEKDTRPPSFCEFA
jgi:integration host factor subunit beta